MTRSKREFIKPEVLLDLQRRIYRVFAPGTPVENPKLFMGRRDELQRVDHFVRAKGEVAFIFGPRGAGKTSLARHAAEKYTREFKWKPALFKSCDRDTSFSEMFAEPLREQGIDVAVVSRAEGTTGGGIKIGYGQIDVSLGKKQSQMSQSEGPAKNANSPSFCAQALAQLQRIYVIDEFDLLENPDTKRKFADFLKFLSDARPQFKLVITGIAEDIQDLIEVHPSTQNNLRKVKLRGMPAGDLKEIIVAGAKLLELEFEDEAATAISQMSDGLARTTHQVARDAALFAVQEGRRTVTLSDVLKAVQRDGDLEDKFEDAIRGSNPEAYRDVLVAAARCDLLKLTTKEVIASYREFRARKGERREHSDIDWKARVGRQFADSAERWERGVPVCRPTHA